MAIATGTAMLGAAAVGGVSSILSGIIGAKAANSAASIQEKAAVADIALQKEGMDYAKASSLPWLESGRTALNQYMFEMGLPQSKAKGPAGAAAAPLATKSKFTATPGYAFQVAEGEKGVTNNLAALGMKNSGAALKALTRFRTGVANQEYGNYLTRLGNFATGGQQQMNVSTAANSNALQGIGRTTQEAAAASASGYIGGANAITGAVNNFNSTAGNALGWASQYREPNRRAA